MLTMLFDKWECIGLPGLPFTQPTAAVDDGIARDIVEVRDVYGTAYRVSSADLMDTQRYKVAVPIRTIGGRKYSDLPRFSSLRKGGVMLARANIGEARP